jgi:hypothetical protein
MLLLLLLLLLLMMLVFWVGRGELWEWIFWTSFVF